MAAHSRRARRRTAETPARANGGSVSPAFQHLLRCLTEAAPPLTVPAHSRWHWHVHMTDNGLRVRPVWDTEDGPLPMTWQGTHWSPLRDGGWTPDDRLDLWSVAAGHVPEQHSVTVRSEEQMDSFIHSLATRGAQIETHRNGLLPLTVGEACTVQSHWEAHPDGGLVLVQEGGFSPRHVVFVGQQVWRLEKHDHQRMLRRVTEGFEALLWAQRYQRLSMDDLSAWATRFSDDERLAKLPLPKTQQVFVVDAIPRVVAHLTNLGDERTFHLGMHLDIRYDGVTVSLHGADVETTTTPDGAMALVQRNRSVERRTLNAIGHAGLRVWPHPFSKRDAFPLGWPVAWLADKDKTWVAGEPPASDLNAWFAQAHHLEQLGVIVEWDARLPFNRAQSQQRWTAHVEPAGRGKSKWLEAGVAVDVNGQSQDLTGALWRVLDDPSFPMDKPEQEPDDAVWLLDLGRDDHGKPLYLDVRRDRLRQLLAPLRHGDRHEGQRGSRLKLPSAALNEVAAWPTEVTVDTRLDALWSRLRQGQTACPAPEGFQGTLRAYQEEGLGWLNFLADMGWGGLLADDMGLGKTVQLLAHLSHRHAHGQLDRPALLVVPASLLHNWQAEARQFAPHLNVVTLYGNDRAKAWEQLDQAQIVLTTYGTMLRVVDTLAEQDPFALVAFDEAQNLKNARCNLALAARKIPAHQRLALSGTPLENHLGELWAQVDLVMPGLLGSRETFRTQYQTPIEKRNDPDALARLRARLAPFLLRRHKSDVAKDLPPKTETVVRLDLGDEQRLLYEAIRAQQKLRVEQAIAEKGMAAASFTVLNALLQMRQACCEPSLLGDAGRGVDSVKRQYLLDRLESLLDEGRRVLVVSGFTQVLDALGKDLAERGLPFELLTGDTPTEQRGRKVERFQQGEVGVFLISLKAGGVGLNLTAADTVIHYDPWWNPAAENQATDRAHRLGQDKPVFVYRLICNDTLEEHILAMQERKSDLADAVLEGLGKGGIGLNESDLSLLFG